jgi:hypothetical protein
MSRLTPVPSVPEARAALDKLMAQRDEAQARKLALSEEREGLAHAALVENDAEARRQLDALTAEAAKLDGLLENLAAAIRTAEAKIKAAEHAVAQHAEKIAAERAMTLLRERQTLAADLEKAVKAEVVARIERYLATGRELHALTGKHVNPEADGYAVTQMILMSLFPLSQQLLARLPAPEPSMRKPLRELAAQADRIHETWVSNVLQPKATAEPDQAA